MDLNNSGAYGDFVLDSMNKAKGISVVKDKEGGYLNIS